MTETLKQNPHGVREGMKSSFKSNAEEQYNGMDKEHGGRQLGHL